MLALADTSKGPLRVRNHVGTDARKTDDVGQGGVASARIRHGQITVQDEVRVGPTALPPRLQHRLRGFTSAGLCGLRASQPLVLRVQPLVLCMQPCNLGLGAIPLFAHCVMNLARHARRRNGLAYHRTWLITADSVCLLLSQQEDTFQSGS